MTSRVLSKDPRGCISLKIYARLGACTNSHLAERLEIGCLASCIPHFCPKLADVGNAKSLTQQRIVRQT